MLRDPTPGRKAGALRMQVSSARLSAFSTLGAQSRTIQNSGGPDFLRQGRLLALRMINDEHGQGRYSGHAGGGPGDVV
jgi:hypothetical protein